MNKLLVLIFFLYSLHGCAQFYNLEDMFVSDNTVDSLGITKVVLATRSRFLDRPDSLTSYLRSKEVYHFNEQGNNKLFIDYCSSFRRCDTTSFETMYRYKYNKYGDVIDFSTYEKGDTIRPTFQDSSTYEYDKNGVKSKRTHFWKSDPPSEINKRTDYFEFDNRGNLINLTLASENGTEVEQIHTYDSNNNLIKVQFLSEGSAEIHEFIFDINGNHLRTEYSYDEGSACGNVPSKEEFEYDEFGKLNVRYDYSFAEDWKSVYEYSSSNQLLSIYQYSKGNLSKNYVDDFKLVNIQTYYYDENGMVVKITDYGTLSKILWTSTMEFETKE